MAIPNMRVAAAADKPPPDGDLDAQTVRDLDAYVTSSSSPFKDPLSDLPEAASGPILSLASGEAVESVFAAPVDDAPKLLRSISAIVEEYREIARLMDARQRFIQPEEDIGDDPIWQFHMKQREALAAELASRTALTIGDLARKAAVLGKDLDQDLDYSRNDLTRSLCKDAGEVAIIAGARPEHDMLAWLGRELDLQMQLLSNLSAIDSAHLESVDVECGRLMDDIARIPGRSLDNAKVKARALAHFWRDEAEDKFLQEGGTRDERLMQSIVRDLLDIRRTPYRRAADGRYSYDVPLGNDDRLVATYKTIADLSYRARAAWLQQAAIADAAQRSRQAGQISEEEEDRRCDEAAQEPWAVADQLRTMVQANAHRQPSSLLGLAAKAWACLSLEHPETDGGAMAMLRALCRDVHRVCGNLDIAKLPPAPAAEPPREMLAAYGSWLRFESYRVAELLQPSLHPKTARRCSEENTGAHWHTEYEHRMRPTVADVAERAGPILEMLGIDWQADVRRNVSDAAHMAATA